MVPAFFLSVYITSTSHVSDSVIFSSVGILLALMILSLLTFFIYPLFYGYEVRNHKVEDVGDITWWFHISLFCGVLYAIGALAINTRFSLLLSLISFVYLLPGWLGTEALENNMNDLDRI